MADRDIKPTDPFSDKLLKLLPAEVTGAYLAIRSVVELATQERVSGQERLPAYVLFGVIIFLTIATPIFLQLMDLITKNSQRIFIASSFFIWSINIEYLRIVEISPAQAVAKLVIPILLILWAALALPVYLFRAAKPQ
jgi:hypothetical protein